MTEHISAIESLGTSVLAIDGGGLAGLNVHYDIDPNATMTRPDGTAIATGKINEASVANAKKTIGLAPTGPAPKNAGPTVARANDLSAQADNKNMAMLQKVAGPTPRASGRRVLNYSIYFGKQELQLRKGPQARARQRQLLTLRRSIDQAAAQNKKQIVLKPNPAKIPRSMLRQIIAADIAKGAHMTLLGPIVAAAKEVGLALKKDDRLELKPPKKKYKIDFKPVPKRNKLLTLGM